MSLFSCVFVFATVWISTIFVIWQYNKSRRHQHERLKDQSPTTTHFTLEEILAKKETFDLFAIHLANEFSIENLAFALEAMQAKNDLIHYNLCSQDEVGLLIPMASERMEKTRRKKRCEEYTVDDLSEDVQYLMDQYIDRSAEYSVNLSASTRNRSLEIYSKLEHERSQRTIDGNGTETDIEMQTAGSGIDIVFSKDDQQRGTRVDGRLCAQYASLLDNALGEIVGLLRSDSFSRFRRSAAYKKLKRES